MQIKELKEAAYAKLLSIVEEKISTAEAEIESARTSIIEDTKSSAGDKYETSREMMQAELTRNGINLTKAMALKKDLLRINIETLQEQVAFGSMVVTNTGYYFISIGIGEVNIDGQKVFCISEVSPIGELILSKKKGEKFDFRGKKLVVKEIL
jgi:transcription elongation GreA/GreB family factor